jgi:hypothetical protein
MNGLHRGALPLYGAAVEDVVDGLHGAKFAWRVISDSDMVLMHADSDFEKQDWMEALRQQIRYSRPFEIPRPNVVKDFFKRIYTAVKDVQSGANLQSNEQHNNGQHDPSAAGAIRTPVLHAPAPHSAFTNADYAQPLPAADAGPLSNQSHGPVYATINNRCRNDVHVYYGADPSTPFGRAAVLRASSQVSHAFGSARDVIWITDAFGNGIAKCLADRVIIINESGTGFS